MQNIRGGRVKLTGIVSPEMEFNHPEKGDALHAMELALSLEVCYFAYKGSGGRTMKSILPCKCIRHERHIPVKFSSFFLFALTHGACWYILSLPDVRQRGIKQRGVFEFVFCGWLCFLEPSDVAYSVATFSMQKLNFSKLRLLHDIACKHDDAQMADFIGNCLFHVFSSTQCSLQAR